MGANDPKIPLEGSSTTEPTPLFGAAEQLRLQTAALDATANAIVIADRSGVILWANPAFTRLTGYEVAYAMGKRPQQLLKSGHHNAAFYRHMWNTILSGEIWHGELINQRQDGSLYTEEMTITPVRDDHDVITHFVAVKQDVTQRKQLEEQFRQAQKMESVGRLAGGVAHDFNNQLSVIMGHADLALTSLAPDDPVRDDLLAVREAAERSAELTRQLLTFARKKVVSPRVIDLNDHVGGSLRMLQRMIGTNVQLVWAPGDGLWEVHMDSTHLDQILTNLCVNARDAIADVGTVRISTDNAVVKPVEAARIPDADAGEFVRLRVEDDGAGIPDELLPKIFEPFFTTKPVGHGTGLGLSSVYGAVRQTGGFVTVRSTVGKGSVFEIYLPRFDGAGAVRSATSCEMAELPRGVGTILLVEDEPAVLQVTAHALRSHGYTVLEASGPMAALAIAEAHGACIDLVLSDLIMPMMNGRDLVMQLRQRMPGLRALFMSGHPGPAIDGGDAPVPSVFVTPGLAGLPLLEKPFTILQLLRTVRRALMDTDA